MARANDDVVGVDDLPEFPKLIHHGWRSGREVVENSHYRLIVLMHEYFSSAE
jgi:hypothetical protein